MLQWPQLFTYINILEKLDLKHVINFPIFLLLFFSKTAKTVMSKIVMSKQFDMVRGYCDLARLIAGTKIEGHSGKKIGRKALKLRNKPHLVGGGGA